MGSFAGICPAIKVVVQPVALATATLFAPSEFTSTVSPVPEFAVVVSYTTQFAAWGVKLFAVVQLWAVPLPLESAQTWGMKPENASVGRVEPPF